MPPTDSYPHQQSQTPRDKRHVLPVGRLAPPQAARPVQLSYAEIVNLMAAVRQRLADEHGRWAQRDGDTIATLEATLEKLKAIRREMHSGDTISATATLQVDPLPGQHAGQECGRPSTGG